MSRAYKNRLLLRRPSVGHDRRREIAKGTLKDSTPLPKTLLYKDIDECFSEWVKEELSIAFEGELLPTISLYSSQRFSEYMQTWGNVDDKKNIILNFKAITRENNPKTGTIVGQTKNIPGEHPALLKTVEAYDSNNRKYYIDYRMKQPMPIDLVYTVSLLTNKYELLNEFNMIVNDKFKAIDTYIQPNGHFIPMKLNDISDESEYSIDNRQFYSQSYNITVMGYIITEDDFIVEERPEIKYASYENEKGTYADIEEFECDNASQYQYKKINLIIHFESCSTSYKFKIDTNFESQTIETENVRFYRLWINDVEVKDFENKIRVRENDEIKIKGLTRFNAYKESIITFKGYDYTDTEPKSNV